MITRKSKREIEKMQAAGDILVKCHKEIAKMIKPGITTMEIDAFVEKFLEEHGATPEQKGYSGYPYAICASLNDEICHGFPRDEKLIDGDIITIDMVVNLDGGLADSAWTYAVGNVDEKGLRLMDVTKTALYKGIEQARAGKRIGTSVMPSKPMPKRKAFQLFVTSPDMGLGQRFMRNRIFRTSDCQIRVFG